MDNLDKNQYARAAEAQLLREQIRIDEEAKHALESPKALAHQALLAAQEALTAAKSHYDGLIDLENQIELRIQRAWAPLHPVRKLPDEILREIFLAWKAVFEPSDYHRHGRIPACLRAASVCRWWRRVALSQPFLWRDIDVDFYRINSWNVDSWIKYLDGHRERSGRVPLDVTVAANDYEPGSKVIVALKNCFTQARSITLDIGKNVDIPNPGFLSCLEVDAPHLRKFHCTISRNWMGDYDDVEVPFFRSAPLLEHLKLSLATLPFVWPTQSNLPTVTAAEIVHAVDAQELMELFVYMPNVTRLTLGDCDLDRDDVVASFSVHSDALTLLHLDVKSVSDEDMIRSMHFPSLEIAALQIQDYALITPFLQYPMYTVSDLWLCVLDIAILDGLRSLDRLTTLRLKEYTSTAADVLQALSCPTAQGSWICPLLSGILLPDPYETGHDSVADALCTGPGIVWWS